MYLTKIARKLYQGEDIGVDIENTVYALDSTTIDLCLTLCPWAFFRSTKSGIKLHTLLDLRGNIPSFIDITSANVHDVQGMLKQGYDALLRGAFGMGVAHIRRILPKQARYLCPKACCRLLPRTVRR